MRESIKTLGASNLSEGQRANLDFYTTDPIAVNDLLKKLPQLKNCHKVLEPCAGTGAIADRFTQLTDIPVDMSDIVSRRNDIKEIAYQDLDCEGQYDLIITNYPYKNSTTKNPIGFSELLVKSLNDIAPSGYVCSFQRLLHLESKQRYEQIYSKYKPEIIYIYSHRMKCYKNGDPNSLVNSSVAYCWAIWHKSEDGKFSKETKIEWIY